MAHVPLHRDYVWNPNMGAVHKPASPVPFPEKDAALDG